MSVTVLPSKDVLSALLQLVTVMKSPGWMLGNAILAYNVLFMVSFLASAFVAFCLAYRWTGAAELGPEFSGRGPIDHDVFPGQAYRFDVTIPPSHLPGAYRLQLGLVSERVTWFEQIGVPPVEVDVTIQDVIQVLR